jgi:signal transduction histidine kinase
VILGGTLLVFYSFGWLPYTLMTKNAWIIGSSAEMILLSLALSARMRKLRDDNAAAQKQVIEQQQMAIEQQKQLVEKEKMASLGLLSAGVAHEINNPNNFVNISAQTAESRIRELQQFINELLADDSGDDMKAEFRQRFDGILSQMKLVSEGSQRIAGIVRGMRSASRQDGDKADWFDPVEGVLATLELVQSNFRHVVRFDSTGLSTGQQVQGFASQMNQVFMNLLVNACHAIEEKKALTDSVLQGNIRLSSVVDAGDLVISIEDDGCGMSSEVQARLFQPFFTTKGKDKGTGLGLGICKSIVKEHGGRLEVQSALGVGTTFRIVLPLSPASTDVGVVAGADR